MRKTFFFLVLGLFLFPQFSKEQSLGLPGDNLDLAKVLTVFQNSPTIEDFESNLNADSTLNYLDLNNDGFVDYIHVFDTLIGSVMNLSLWVDIDTNTTQNVAYIRVEKVDGQVSIQVIGDEALYGKDYIIEPGKPNPSTMNKNSTDPIAFLIHTDLGDMKGILYNQTPNHRDNFVKLVKSGFYDGTLFHRVIMGFMIQGGDPTSKTAKPGQRLGGGDLGYTIPAEFNPAIQHKRGALAAARTGDNVNPSKASSASQFYIVQPDKGTHFLDMNYTVFGEITDGFDVIDKIASAPKDASDRPIDDIKMTIQIID